MPNPVPGPHNLLNIDLDTIAENLQTVRGCLPKGVRVAGVVKSDAYGHGMVPVARKLKEAGAEFLAVAHAEEGAILRREGLAGPIILLLGMVEDQAAKAARLRLTPVLQDFELIEALSGAAKSLGLKAQCHIKLDSGMGRLGLSPGDVMQLLRRSSRLDGVQIRGIVSHLATGGEADKTHAEKQARVFSDVIAQAAREGIELPDSSLSNSGGAIAPPPGMPGAPFIARVGIALYGGHPDQATSDMAPIKGAMRFSSSLLLVKPVGKGTPVSYGCTWTAPENTWLGVVAAGYGDGYPRSASNKASMLVHGGRAPVVGRVCMNLTVLDLGNFEPLPRPGDEVVLLGRQDNDEITPDELATWADTIPYEILCRLGASNKQQYQPA